MSGPEEISQPQWDAEEMGELATRSAKNQVREAFEYRMSGPCPICKRAKKRGSCVVCGTVHQDYGDRYFGSVA